MLIEKSPLSSDNQGQSIGIRERRRIYTISALIFFSTLLITSLLVLTGEGYRQTEKRAAAIGMAAVHGHDIQERIERSLSASYALAAVVHQNNGDVPGFEQLAHELLSAYGGISALQLAPKGIIRRIVPLEGNEKSLGHDLLTDLSRNKEAHLAVATKKLTLAGPLELVQGGGAVIGRLPVFLKQEGGEIFWGFVTVLVRIPDLLRVTRLHDMEKSGYRYQLWRTSPDTGSPQIIASSDSEPLIAPTTYAFAVSSGQWSLSIEPANGWIGYPRLIAESCAALALALLAMLFGHNLLMRPLTLRLEVAARTRDLLQANASLEHEIAVRQKAEVDLRLSRYSVEQASDALFWITPDAYIIDANAAACRSLDYSLEALLKLRVYDFDALYNEKVWPHHWQNLRQCGSLTFESIQRDRNGREFPVEIVANHVCFGDREYNCAFVRDISARKKQELDLRIAATAFESQEGMTITGADLRILRVNRAFTEITGYTAEEAIGRTPALLRSGRHDDQFYREMWQTLKAENHWAGEIWNRRKNGDIYPQWLTISAVTDTDGGITHYIGAFSDTSDRVAAEKKIRNLAFYDPLTELPNRRLLMDRLQQAAASSNRSLCYGALLLLDLDNFKVLNDTLGHEMGDCLLIAVSKRLLACVGDGDTVARTGGDEFAIILQNTSDSERHAATQAEHLAEKLIACLAMPYDLDGREYHCTSSIGISLFLDHQVRIEDLLKRVETAMYEAKGAGRNTLRFFDPAMQAALEQHLALEDSVRLALQNDEYLLYYQLQVDVHGKPIGAEALIRWQHPQRGIISPGEFIPLAEETGLIIPMGEWAIRTACQELANWADKPHTRDLQIAVNVSARQFRENGFVETVRQALLDTGASARRLKLELTESVMLEDIEATVGKMRTLRQLGISFSMDDFGTGYSSLSYLQKLPIAQLKIDQSFVRDLVEDSNDAAITLAIITLGESLGIEVIAEGVENETQHAFLVRNNCHAFQGYLFAKPLPVEDFLLHLESICRPPIAEAVC
jgi:diguanylate cyclase (GGDEF)-like protein/PAS domain S-box-containing protein